jgi:hypothetical protein
MVVTRKHFLLEQQAIAGGNVAQDNLEFVAVHGVPYVEQKLLSLEPVLIAASVQVRGVFWSNGQLHVYPDRHDVCLDFRVTFKKCNFTSPIEAFLIAHASSADRTCNPIRLRLTFRASSSAV